MPTPPHRLLVALRCAVLVCVLIACVWLGGHPQLLPDGARQLLTDTPKQGLLEEGRAVLHENYWRELDDRKTAEQALRGAVEQDRFSKYLSPSELESFTLRSRGSYGGIGVELRPGTRSLQIMKVMPDSPARRAGLKAGDVIVAVDGKPVSGADSDVAASRIRGRLGTQVRLRVRSGKRVRDVRLERAQLKVRVVDSRLIGSGKQRTVHVVLAAFTEGSAVQVREHVRRGLKRGATRVLLDLRSNGGGLVSEAVGVSSIFLPEGQTVVFLRGRKLEGGPQTYKARGKPVSELVEVAVLTDPNTASASEIVAGALQDTGRGRLVGEPTFGKGVFQQLFPLQNGGALELTVGAYFTPKNRNLGRGAGQGKGLQPDVRAPDDPKTVKVDETVQAALSDLSRR